MLFNSYTFVFLFLPSVLAVYFLCGASGSRKAPILWLTAASLFFYAWWRPPYLILIIASKLTNYTLGLALGRTRHPRMRKATLVLGVIANIGLLAYFKYATFLLSIYNQIAPLPVFIDKVVLPLGISFFTFQQIAYLVDAYRGEAGDYNFIEYCLFVSFFPQLIAGPIVHHKELLPQFRDPRIFHFQSQTFSVGLVMFFLGLAKKVLIADSVARYANPVFSAAQAGHAPSFLGGWVAMLAYAFQLYFSGYSDMCLGLAQMMGIRLPLNFNSPYKAVNIIDFWRRWHITLSRWLREYLYFPLGGNRKGAARRYANLMLTMLLGGLWHGAGWTFVFWGGLHGLYLAVNHFWRYLRGRLGYPPAQRPTGIGRAGATLLTFLCVIVAWVFFRADSFGAATSILASVAGLHGLNLALTSEIRPGLAWIIFLLPAVWLLPNTQQFLDAFAPAIDYDSPASRPDAPNPFFARWIFQPSAAWGVAVGLLSVAAILGFTRASAFIYFNF
jgi:alginate O-acetyltransferase complex protein AlgI